MDYLQRYIDNLIYINDEISDYIKRNKYTEIWIKKFNSINKLLMAL